MVALLKGDSQEQAGVAKIWEDSGRVWKGGSRGVKVETVDG